MKTILSKIGLIAKKMLTKIFWVSLWSRIKIGTPKLAATIWMFVTFFILLIVFLFKRLFSLLRKTPLAWPLDKLGILWNKKLAGWLDIFLDKLDSHRGSEIRRTRLIELAYQNMNLKKGRSFITIGGMAVGIGAIVFLVSLGYGLEKLVISRVARLEELRMADVSPGESSALRLNDDVMGKINKMPGVEETIPVISVVGRVNFKNAIADIVAYAAPKKYLTMVQIKPARGKIFESDQITYNKSGGKVSGAKTELTEAKEGQEVATKDINFNIIPEERLAVWDKPSLSGDIIGYSVRVEGGFWGREYWGSAYRSDDGVGREGYDSAKRTSLGCWLRAKMPLVEETAGGSLIPILDDSGRQRWQWGWLMEKSIQVIEERNIGEVLGETTGGAVEGTGSAELSASASAGLASIASPSASLAFETATVSTDSSGVEWVQLTSSESAKKKSETTVNFEDPPSGEALVSSGMLRMFSIEPQDAVGQTFKVSFIIVKSLMPEADGKVVSQESEYRIIGVIEDLATPYFYVPLLDLRKAGISNFSQLRVVVKNKNDLPGIRKEIETMGLKTSSTVDTVAQIENLFKNIRLILAILGLVALAVAVLGMFNTLTVSLLERTREIGGMKAMGMVSHEVQDLFLAEAMIMGLSGGIGGIALGFVFGKLISLILSSMAVVKGQGLIDITSIPAFFIGFIVVASFIVGFLTGLYPAKRAMKISALNALRYE